MSAAEALKAARIAGVELRLDGDDLVLEASSPPPDTVLDRLSRHKPGIVALLRHGWNGWTAEDWQAFFDERAAIAEFDGGLPRAQAEGRAFACCVVEWLNRNFACSLPECTLVPLSHSRCWPSARKAEAIAALATMGIAARCEFPDDFGKNGGA
jgi:hypothetical protein